MRANVVAIAALAAALAGCARTVYRHLEPPAPTPLTPPKRAAADETSGWQSFFLFGWVPSERVIDAAAICGGPDFVREIHTEQTFGQGVVAVFTSYYVTIYDPYTAEVFCTSGAGARR